MIFNKTVYISENFKTEEDQSVDRKSKEDNTTIESGEITKSDLQSCILQHPLSNLPQDKEFNTALKYPKRVVSEKNEFFDVDDICLKTKEKYYLPSDPVIATIKTKTTSEKSESRNVGALPEMYSSSAVSSKRKQIVQKKILDNNETNTSLQESKTSKDLSMKNLNTSRPIHAAKPLVDYLNTLNGLKESTPLNRSSYKKMKKKIQMVQEVKFDKNGTMEEKYNSNYVSVDCTGAALQAPAARQQKNILKEVSKQMTVNLEKQIENLSKNLLPSQPELIATTNNELIAKETQQFKSRANDLLDTYEPKDILRGSDGMPPIAKAVRYSEQLQRILNQYKYDGYVSEQGISKCDKESKSEIEINKVQTKSEVGNKGIPNVKHEALYPESDTVFKEAMDTKLPPSRKITGEKLEQMSNHRNIDQDGTVVKTMTDISSTKHVETDFKKHHIKSRQDSSNPNGNLMINHKKSNWREMKEQLKKISLVEKIEGTPIIKRGESLNAHATNVSEEKIIKLPDIDKTENKICTKFARYLLKENDNFQTDQMSQAKELKKIDGPSGKSKLSNQVKYQKINEVQIKNELEERLQKLKLIIDNKSRNRQNQRISTERNNNDQSNIRNDFSENTLSLDMYDSRAEPLPQRPVIRKEKPPMSEKKEKQKSKNPIILPPQQGSSEKKLDGTLIFSKNESAGQYTDNKVESNTENERKSDIPKVIQPSKNHEQLDIEVEDIHLYRPRYRISQEVKVDNDNVINLDESQSVVEIKSLPESETAKETEEEGTSKVIIKPFPDNLIRKTVNEKKSHIFNDSNTTFKLTSKKEKPSRYSMLSKQAFTPNYKKTLVGEIQNNLKLDWDTTIEDVLNESIWEEVSNLKRDILRPILTKNDVSTVYKKRFANKCVEVTNDNLWKNIQNYTRDSHNNSRNTVNSDIQSVKDYRTNKKNKQNLDRQCITEFDKIMDPAPTPKKLNIYFKKRTASENLRNSENEQNSIYKEVVLQHDIDNVSQNIGGKNLLKNQLNLGIGDVENKRRKKGTQEIFIGQNELGKDNKGFRRNTQNEKSVANLGEEIFIRKSPAANKGIEGNQSLRTCGDSTIWKSDSSLSYKSANNFSNPIEGLSTKKNMNIDINSFNEKQYRIHFPTESVVVQNLPEEKVVSEVKYNKNYKFPESASENTIKLNFQSPSPRDEKSEKSVKLNHQAKTVDFDSSKPSFSSHFYYTNEFKNKRPLSMNDFRTSSSNEKSSRKTKVDLNIDKLKRHNEKFDNFMNSRDEKINRHDGSSSQTKAVVHFTYKKSKLDGNHLSFSSNLENFGNEIYGKHLNTYEKQDSRTYKVNYKKSDIDYSKPIISNNSRRNKIMTEDSSGRQLNVNPKPNRIEKYNKAKLSTFNQNVNQLKNIYYLHDNDCRKMTAQLIEEFQRNYKKKLVMESRKTMSNSQIAKTNSPAKKRTNVKHRERNLKKQYSHRPQTAPAMKVSSVAPRLRLLTINTLNGCEKVEKLSKRIPEQLSNSKFTQEHLDFSVKPETQKTSHKRVKRRNFQEENEIKFTKPQLFEIPQRPQTERSMNRNDFPGFKSKTSSTLNYKNRRFQEYKPQNNEVVEANVRAPKNIHRLTTGIYVQGNNHKLVTEHNHKQMGAKKNNLEVLVKDEICPDCFPKKNKRSDDKQNKKKRERNSKNMPQKVVVKLDNKDNQEHQLYQQESFQKNSITEKSTEDKEIVVEQGSVDNNSKNIVVNLILPKAMKNLENHENDIICKPRNVTPRETDNATTALSIPAEEEFTWKNDKKIFVNLFIPKPNHKALKQHKSIPKSKTENNVLQAATEHVLPNNKNDDLRKEHTNEVNEKSNKSTQKVESNYNQSGKNNGTIIVAISRDLNVEKTDQITSLPTVHTVNNPSRNIAIKQKRDLELDATRNNIFIFLVEAQKNVSSKSPRGPSTFTSKRQTGQQKLHNIIDKFKVYLENTEEFDHQKISAVDIEMRRNNFTKNMIKNKFDKNLKRKKGKIIKTKNGNGS